MKVRRGKLFLPSPTAPHPFCAMSLPLYQVDAFADRPFNGNPAAVCLLPAEREAAWMQHVAREINLSETAFLVGRGGGDGYDLRWFTPTNEVDLCGHATLASAHVLWETGRLPAGELAVFHTRSGRLTASQGSGGWIEMDFPAEPEREAEAPPGLAEALGARPRYVGRNRMDYLVLLEREADVRGLRPDLTKLARVETRGVIATASAEEGRDYDFVSRFFAPRYGVDEDPVTGSAHCCLGPFWRGRLGTSALVGYQASARGGFVRVEVGGERVRLAGQAVTVLRAELLTGTKGGAGE